MAGSTSLKSLPWLVSSSSELASDEAALGEWEARYATSYPGVSAPLEEKRKWAENAQKPSKRRTRQQTDPPAFMAQDMVAKIVFDKCDEEVDVRLVAMQEDLEDLKKMEWDQETFIRSAERRRCPILDDEFVPHEAPREVQDGFFRRFLVRPLRSFFGGGSKEKGEKSRASLPFEPPTDEFFDWLLKEDEEYEILASLRCKKQALTAEIISELQKKIGLTSQRVCRSFVGGDADMREIVGENLSFNDKSIPFILTPMELANPSAFVAELDRVQSAHRNSKTYMLVAKKSLDEEEEDEEEEITASNHGVLWLSCFYDNEHERAASHTKFGLGETSNRRVILTKDDKKAATLKLDLFFAEVNALKSRFQKSDPDLQSKKFCAVLALTHALTLDHDWFHEIKNDALKDLVTHKLGDAWRTLLKLDDDTLGIGLPSFDQAEPRASLLTFLDQCKILFKRHNLVFNYMPRKRKTNDSNKDTTNKKTRTKSETDDNNEDDDDEIMAS